MSCKLQLKSNILFGLYLIKAYTDGDHDRNLLMGYPRVYLYLSQLASYLERYGSKYKGEWEKPVARWDMSYEAFVNSRGNALNIHLEFWYRYASRHAVFQDFLALCDIGFQSRNVGYQPPFFQTLISLRIC